MNQASSIDLRKETFKSDGVSDSSVSDTGVEAILNKRPALIENAYNKNLREDTANLNSSTHGNPTDAIQNPSSSKRNSLTCNSDRVKSAHATAFSTNTSTNLSYNQNSLLNEKTFLSFSSLGDLLGGEESDGDEQDNDSLDGGISKYEDACHGLMIGVSSIVLKSLKTTAVILSNYGLNSVRVLALCNALKVNQ